jgi:outer membrane protein assembly factor BamE (lipoprotein component of BamABCDE complex)
VRRETHIKVAQMKRLRVLVTVCLLTALALACISIALWNDARLPVRTAALKSLRPGASQDEVLRILGAPYQVWSDNRTWSYSKESRARIVYVVFDANLRYERYDVDD